MSRIDELKKQHPLYALSTIDIFKMISPNQSSKYIEMLIKLDKNREFNEPDVYRRQIIECMVGWGIDYNYLETFDLETLNMFFINVNNLVGDTGKISLFTKFASLNERKLIENNDVTTYSSWDEIEQAVALAEIKLIDKETAKQIKKVYEDDEWLSLRPLSLEASMKYGANTKWCTTTESGQYYARYSSRGVLIYNINKKTGYKVACFKNIDPNHDNEFSWWDVTDKKIEALDSEASSAVLEAIRNEIKNNGVPNQTLMTPEESDKLHYYKEGIQQSQMHGLHTISDSRMHITGGFNWGTTTGTGTLTTGGSGGIINAINNSGYTTTNTIYTSGNVGIGNINPTSQLQINGDLEVREGAIRFTNTSGNERARLTADGLEFTPGPEYNHFERTDDDTIRLIQELTRELNGGDRIAADAQQRLDDAMAEQLAAANERVAEKHLSLLENIEMGTVEQRMIERMQALAGIETREMRIKRTEAELEQLRTEIRREEEIAAEIETQREALKGDIHSSAYEAEQPVVSSKQQKNIWEQIKSLWSK
jgi:hypothetical protein